MINEKIKFEIEKIGVWIYSKGGQQFGLSDFRDCIKNVDYYYVDIAEVENFIDIKDWDFVNEEIDKLKQNIEYEGQFKLFNEVEKVLRKFKIKDELIENIIKNGNIVKHKDSFAGKEDSFISFNISETSLKKILDENFNGSEK